MTDGETRPGREAVECWWRPIDGRMRLAYGEDANEEMCCVENVRELKFFGFLYMYGLWTWTSFRMHRGVSYYCYMNFHTCFVAGGALRGGRRVWRPAQWEGRGCVRRGGKWRASSLEDSKKRARSPYDNIPDLNRQYVNEINRLEGKYGRKVTDVSGSILRPTGARLRDAEGARGAAAGEATVGGDDMEGFTKLRNYMVGDTVTIGLIGVCAAWSFTNAQVAGGVGLGVVGGVAYVALLSRGVERSGGAQPGRLAIVALLVAAGARVGLVLPVVLGFLSYKIAVLLPLLTGTAFDDI